MAHKHVLDTHALIWYLEGNPRLGLSARSVLDDAQHPDQRQHDCSSGSRTESNRQQSRWRVLHLHKLSHRKRRQIEVI